ncbi:hypothetical protein FMM58_02415 [Campylobacter sp. LR291e]|nr:MULTISPECIES: hypothetical protein [unclassified Campylobacter]KAA6225056.1 hypothetical protein FMM55_07095 [Campylobacter sp. LR196d]KAA6231481.1 hypothetical protein FMM58_02415 [Campylobacter sp. LR291e]
MEPYHKLPFKLINRDLKLHYENLYSLNTKILILILPLWRGECNIIDNLHKHYASHFGFNIIDIKKYYENNKISDFGKSYGVHQAGSLMREIGKNIIKNLNNFSYPKKDIKTKNTKFEIVKPSEMKLIKGDLEEINISNSMFNETCYRLNKDTILQFDERYKGLKLIGIHSWLNGKNLNLDFNVKNFTECRINYSSIILENKDINISKGLPFMNIFIEIQKNFIIDEKSIVKINYEDFVSEIHHITTVWLENAKCHKYADIIAFFLVENEEDEKNFNFDELNTYSILIDKKYDFTHIMPNILLLIKDFNQYAQMVKNKALKPLQDENIKLKNELSLCEGPACTRVKNHLCYKFGKAIIINSKSFMGLIRLPFVLSYINEEHKKNLKINLTPLEKCRDYKESLKIKNYLSYKLGDSFIKHYKKWYKGGLIKFYFEAKRLEREFKKPLSR